MKYFIPLLAVMCLAIGGCKSTCCGKCGGHDHGADKKCCGTDGKCCKKAEATSTGAKACAADCTKACCAKKE